MLDFLRYNLFDIFSLLIYPFYLLFDSFLSLFRGDLFPINFRFGYTCGPAGGYEPLGDGKAWLAIFAFLVVLITRLITKKPKNLLLTLLVVYIAMFLVHFLSYLIGGPGPDFCM
jgi:hypothetical protein